MVLLGLPLVEIRIIDVEMLVGSLPSSYVARLSGLSNPCIFRITEEKVSVSM